MHPSTRFLRRLSCHTIAASLWFDEIVTCQLASLGGPRTIIEALLDLRPFTQSNVVSFCELAMRNPRFLMLTGERDWLFPTLIDDRARINTLAGSEPGDAILSVSLDRPGAC